LHCRPRTHGGADPDRWQPVRAHHGRILAERFAEPDGRCTQYLTVTTELYKAVQQNYRAVWDESRDWAQATLDAILSLDLVQVRIRRADGGVSAKAVMLPLHPLHLWRYQRLGEVLRICRWRELCRIATAR